MAITRRTRSHGRKPPATQAERDALTWPATEGEFDRSNDDWANEFLPCVRFAYELIQRDHNGLKDVMARLVKDGAVPDALEALTGTKNHLNALAKILETALLRSFLVLERLGYSPDNPPPDNVIRLIDRPHRPR